MHAKITLKLENNENVSFFGPGVAELFQLIETTGSVRHAAETMGLSYSKAWKMIRGTEKATGEAVVDRTQGGKGGGKADLTSRGKKLLEDFLSMEKELNSILEEMEEKYLAAYR